MSSRQALPGVSFWLLGATLILPVLGAPTGCSSSAGQGTVIPDGGAGAAGTAGPGGSGGGASGRAGGGASGAAGGGGAGAGGASGAAGQAGSQTCTNAPHVLPLNPSNPQDGITLGAFYVDTDTWNAASYSVSQTMYVCDYDSWYVVASMDNATGDGAVKTYPDVHEDFSAAPAIGSFSVISSSFAHAGPHVGIYEFAYDIWLNGVASSGSTEVMIWTDNFNQVPSGSVQETVTFDGQSYQVYKSGSYIAFVETTNVTSGTVNLLEFFNHIIAKGWIPSTSTLGAIDYGVELVSTGGMDATFAVNGFSLTAN
jgi:Glycosyl hydrolase family 12